MGRRDAAFSVETARFLIGLFVLLRIACQCPRIARIWRFPWLSIGLLEFRGF